MMPLLIALQFLTVIPIQLKRMPTARENGLSVLYYPVVGALIGGLLYGLALLLLPVPDLLSAVLIMSLWVILSGGLHLDGLADTADAWVGGFADRQRTLQIMKDPRCGPIGVLSLVCVCLIKVAAVSLLLAQQQLWALILFPILGRLAPLFLLISCDYVRANGIGSSIAASLPKWGVVVVLIMGFAISAFFGVLGWGSALIALLLLMLLRLAFIRRLGGITGDCIGASVELVEVVALLSFVLLIFYL